MRESNSVTGDNAEWTKQNPTTTTLRIPSVTDAAVTLVLGAGFALRSLTVRASPDGATTG